MVAVLFGVLAGAALALCSAWLTIQYVIEVRQSSRHKAALAQLEQASTRDAARVAELRA